MDRNLTIMGITIVLLLTAFFVHAEKATEINIPIGQSPGLSGKHTVLGKIDQVNVGARTFTVADDAGRYKIKVAKKTSIYLDRSSVRQANSYGSVADCKKGDHVEVKWENNDRKKSVEWIKVEKSK